MSDATHNIAGQPPTAGVGLKAPAHGGGRGLSGSQANQTGYEATRNRVETYFDRTATRTWERLTSDAPVSGIRATVRAGRDKMRDLLIAQMPDDLTGARILDAGCGTGALAFELAAKGADVTGIDVSPQLIDIAIKRAPTQTNGSLTFQSGDMLDPALGTFDYVIGMDSMIYYDAADITRILDGIAPRISEKFVFTVAPRTTLLMLMWRAGKLFPRSDRSPTMVPHDWRKLAANTAGNLTKIDRVTSGFYISEALEFRP